MKIAVYGAGGVGGYFGGRLSQAQAEVHLIARGAHLEALKQKGLRVQSELGDFRVSLPATDRPEKVGPCDYVLFCVKSFDTETAAGSLSPLLKPETAVISLQNGIDNEDKIVREVGDRHVLAGVAYIFSTIAEPGVLEQRGPARIVFGERNGVRSQRAVRFQQLCRHAGVEAQLSENIQRELWLKFGFICAQAGMTAAVRRPIGEILDVQPARKMFEQILREVQAVGRAEGVNWPDHVLEDWMEFTRGLDPCSYSSLYYDLTHDKPIELEALVGVVVRLGEKHRVNVSASEALYSILKPWEVHIRSQ